MTEKNERMEQLAVFKHVMDFSSLTDSANRIQSQCTDFTVKETSKRAHFGEDLMLQFFAEGDTNRRLQMSDHAFSQLCAKMEVPVRYMRKCIDDGEVELVADNINTWLHQYDKPLFLRTYDNKVRGVLSDKFSVLDTPDILDVVQDTVQDEYKVKSYFMNEERFHARLLQNDMLPIAGEDLFGGIQIDSSDVGRSILIVKFMIYKQVCTNGLTVSKGGGILFEQKHIGISADDFRTGLRESIERIPDLVANFSQSIEDSRKNKLTAETVRANIEKMREQLRVTEETGEKVINLMDEKYSRTRWGLINGITEVAQQFTLERRLELEKYAGNLLNVA